MTRLESSALGCLVKHLASVSNKIERVIWIGCYDAQLAKGLPVSRQIFVSEPGVDVSPDESKILDKINDSNSGVVSPERLEVDFKYGLDITDELLENSIVLCLGVVERLSDPRGLVHSLALARERCSFMLLTCQDRLRVSGYGHALQNDDPNLGSGLSADEFFNLLTGEGFSAQMLFGHGSSEGDLTIKNTVLALSGRDAEPKIVESSEQFRVAAIINLFNEADIIEEVVRHLSSQGIEVHLFDNWSTDGSFELCQKLLLEGLVNNLQRFPDSPSNEYIWAQQLKNTANYAATVDADWIMHYDADEIRCSPWPEFTLKQAIAYVNRLGYTAIDFTVIDFRYIESNKEPHCFEDSLRHFEFPTHSSYFLQVKAWKKNEQLINLHDTGGHAALFSERVVYPLKFLNKHYSLRSQTQADKKIYQDRLPRVTKERLLGWHVHLDRFREATHVKPWSRSSLICYSPVVFNDEFLIERISGCGLVRSDTTDGEGPSSDPETHSSAQVKPAIFLGLDMNVSEELKTEILKLDSNIFDQISAREHTIRQLNHQIEEEQERSRLAEQTIEQLNHQIKTGQAQFGLLVKSSSWRITTPLREFRRILVNPRVKFHQYFLHLIRYIKNQQHIIPLSFPLKKKIYGILCRLNPALSNLSVGRPPVICSATLAHNPLVDTGEEINGLNFSLPACRGIPIISVIIPIYGKLSYTLRCLESISANFPQTPTEILVIDDCSTDNSFECLSKLKNLRLLRNSTNRGFIRSCNYGAASARGAYLLFLNNDTEVAPGWADELVRTFTEFPGTGLAGSKLVYPDGTLQEAGGIIWRDGSAWNFGRFQDQTFPVYNYAREVDYCSGASIMIPKNIFFECGGFDEHYLPAYCEDSDLALRIRERGLRVIYQPLSVVVHYEGITSGTDINHGTKAFQVENTKKLYLRWHQRLASHQSPGEAVDAAKDRRANLRVLFLDHCTPSPNKDSGSVDAFNHMLLFREMNFQVTFIAEDNLLFIENDTARLQRNGIEVLYSPYIRSVKEHLKEYGSRYDLIFLSRPLVFERNIGLVREYCARAKVWFHTVDLHYLRMEREANLFSSARMQEEAQRMKRRELSFAAEADVTTVVSATELMLMEKELPDSSVRLLPFARQVVKSLNKFDDRKDIIFLGGFQHAPNVDAVLFFVNEVMPLVRTLCPGIRLYLVGSNVPPLIKALDSSDIVVRGFVERLLPLLEQMRVSIAPLRFGAGIKGKIGSALSVGLPVVATSIAVEGMLLNSQEHVLVADSAVNIADAIARLYRDKALWEQISKAGLVFAEEAWGAEAAWSNMARILSELGMEVKSSKYPLSLYTEV